MGNILLFFDVRSFCKFLFDLNTVLYPAFLYAFLNLGDNPGTHGSVIIGSLFGVSFASLLAS